MAKRKPRVWIVHGIHVTDTSKSVGKLGPYFEAAGYEVEYFNYGYAYVFRTRCKNTERARKLAQLIRPGDLIVGHSNGCTLAYLATRVFNAPASGVVLLNPALNDDAVFPDQVRFIHVYHHDDDRWTNISRLLFFHPWGRMGQVGYQGDKDGRYINYDLSRYTYSGNSAHSIVIKRAGYFAPIIIGRLDNALK